MGVDVKQPDATPSSRTDKNEENYGNINFKIILRPGRENGEERGELGSIDVKQTAVHHSSSKSLNDNPKTKFIIIFLPYE